MIKDIYEAIAHCEEVAKGKRELTKTICPWADDGEETLKECLDCAADHEQLAKWLTQLAKVMRIVEYWNSSKGSFISIATGFQMVLDVFKEGDDQ